MLTDLPAEGCPKESLPSTRAHNEDISDSGSVYNKFAFSKDCYGHVVRIWSFRGGSEKNSLVETSEENCLVNENVVNQSWREGEVQEDVLRHASVRVQN